MRPRQNIIELFTSFIKFEQDMFKGWIIAPKLQRSLERILPHFLKLNNQESLLALYWHDLWRLESSKLATEHLAAYLQEVCYWAAYKTLGKLKDSKYKLSDCFQMAISQLNTVLKGFDSSVGSNLKSYAGVSFRSLLINSLRTFHEADLSSNWALLRKISQKRLETSLTEAGLNKDKIAEYVLAWSCYKIIFVPNKTTGIRQLSEPSASDWNEMANLYNTQRVQQLGTLSPTCDAAKIESRLKNCGKCVRAYLFPSVDSLNQVKAGYDNVEMLEDLPATGESLLNTIIEREETSKREQQQLELQEFLSQTVETLKPELQNVLKLYYIDGLTQTEIAKQLDTKQYAVSRNLTRARDAMLKALAKWSNSKFEVNLTSEVIAQMDEVLEEWLQNYFRAVKVVANNHGSLKE